MLSAKYTVQPDQSERMAKLAENTGLVGSPKVRTMVVVKASMFVITIVVLLRLWISKIE